MGAGRKKGVFECQAPPLKPRRLDDKNKDLFCVFLILRVMNKVFCFYVACMQDSHLAV